MVLVMEAVKEAAFQLLIYRLLIVLQKIKKYEHEAQTLLYPLIPISFSRRRVRRLERVLHIAENRSNFYPEVTNKDLHELNLVGFFLDYSYLLSLSNEL